MIRRVDLLIVTAQYLGDEGLVSHLDQVSRSTFRSGGQLSHLGQVNRSTSRSIA